MNHVHHYWKYSAILLGLISIGLFAISVGLFVESRKTKGALNGFGKDGNEAVDIDPHTIWIERPAGDKWVRLTEKNNRFEAGSEVIFRLRTLAECDWSFSTDISNWLILRQVIDRSTGIGETIMLSEEDFKAKRMFRFIIGGPVEGIVTTLTAKTSSQSVSAEVVFLPHGF